jgi:hypothetical protein
MRGAAKGSPVVKLNGQKADTNAVIGKATRITPPSPPLKGGEALHPSPLEGEVRVRGLYQ